MRNVDLTRRNRYRYRNTLATFTIRRETTSRVISARAPPSQRSPGTMATTAAVETFFPLMKGIINEFQSNLPPSVGREAPRQFSSPKFIHSRLSRDSSPTGEQKILIMTYPRSVSGVNLGNHADKEDGNGDDDDDDTIRQSTRNRRRESRRAVCRGRRK